MSELQRKQAEERDVLRGVYEMQIGHQELANKRGKLSYLVMFDDNE